MALPTSVFYALDKCDVQADGGFVLPYTVVLDGGAVAAAFHTTSEHGLRKEYDLAPRVLLSGLGLESELIDFVIEHDRMRTNRLAATFVEVITKGAEWSVDRALNAEFLTPQQTHNVLWRGSAESRPFGLIPDIAATMAEEEHRKSLGATKGTSKRRTEGAAKLASAVSAPASNSVTIGTAIIEPVKRTGVLQRMAGVEFGDNAAHVSTIRLDWRRTGPGEVNEVYFDANSTTQLWTITERRNIHRAMGTRKFPYERGCTFEGPAMLSEDTTAATMTEERQQRVVRAAQLILSRCQHHLKRAVSSAELLFRFSGDGSKLFFLYATYLETAGTSASAPKPRFLIPRQYATLTKRLPRPRCATTNEEDLIVDPKLQIVLSPERRRPGGGGGLDHSRSPARTRLGLGDDLASVLQRQSGGADGSANNNGNEWGSDPAPQTSGGLDYDSVLRAVRSSFPAPLPEHTRSASRPGTHGGLRLSPVGARAQAPLERTGGSVNVKKVSPTPLAERENPTPNYEAIAQRQYAAIVSNTRSLLAVLEGRRPLDDRFAELCQLTPSQRRFLKGELARAAAGPINGSAKITYAEERGLPEWADPTKRRAATSLGGSRKSSTDGRKRRAHPPPIEERPRFYVAQVDHSREDREVLRRGSQFDSIGRPEPLRRRSRSYLPAGGFESANRALEERAARANERSRRRQRLVERVHAEVHGASRTAGHGGTGGGGPSRSGSDELRLSSGADRRSSSASSASAASSSRSSSATSQLSSRRLETGTASVRQSRAHSSAVSPATHSLQTRPLEFPELADFAFFRTATAGGDGDDEGAFDGGRQSIAQFESSITSAVSGSRGGGSAAQLQASKANTELCRLDQEAEALNIGRSELTTEQRVEFVLAQPLPAPVAAVPRLVEAATVVQRSVRAAVDYLDGLAYHLNSYKLARTTEQAGASGSAAAASRVANLENSSSRIGGSDGNTPLLLFSVPLDLLGPMGRRVVALLKALPCFEQMNTEENISELQFMLMESVKNRQRTSSAAAAGGSGAANSAALKQHATALDDALYATHAQRGANIVSIPTFAVRAHVAHHELRTKFNNWVLSKLRAVYLERLEELRDEAEALSRQPTAAPAATVADGRGDDALPSTPVP